MIGAKIDVRISDLTEPIYQFAELNKSSMVIISNASPITAAWMTRNFNPDLIDNATETFDEAWEQSISILEITSENFKKIGASLDTVLSKAAREVTKSKD
ncbi:MAG: hypothetical protein BAJATHORv1_70002 [Candidatus Thorarchaeota archaeon]|nr:MAG: hypothetical protein BAJATHORv1_70002 [Candidatus Thorarchaeota archaeon]